ncbi:unnamed protein product [Brachionus calyciflorus]|uniref:PWWP domain-containing protein n=1 Tax=Brachionus calyciflorus TaxID=104777 RepID=A0A813Q3J8_9BILA|nr:unnamed protein product [Brachionus calyciflorus]
MAAAIASSNSSHKASNSKTNIRSNNIDSRKSSKNSGTRSPAYILPSMLKTNFGQHEHKIAKNTHSDESHKNGDTFNLYDLVWAKLDKHPWWPCKIVNDAKNIFRRKIGERFIYHVESIETRKENAWVLDINILKFEGFDSFKIYAQEQVDRATSKSAKEELAEKYQLVIPPDRSDEWKMALQHADLMKRKTILAQNQNKMELKRKRENGVCKDDFNDASSFSRMYTKNENLTQSNYNSTILQSKNQGSKSLMKKLRQSENIYQNVTDINNNIKPNFKVEDLSDEYEAEENDYTNENNNEQHDNYEHTTLSSIINEHKNMAAKSKKKSNDNLKSPVQTQNTCNPYPDNELKLKIKLNNIPRIKEENLSDNEFKAENGLYRSRTNSSSSERSRSSSSSSNSSSSTCSSSTSESSSCTSSDNNEINDNLSELKKNLSPASSNWSSSLDYEFNNNSLNTNIFLQRNLSDSVVERINVKKQNARKSSTSLCLSSPTPSLPTPIKAKNKGKISGRKRSSKSLSESTSIDNSLFDENNLLSSAQNFNESIISSNGSNTTPETYLIDRYKYAVRHIKQGLSVEEACNKYRISKGALLKCLSGGTAPRGKKTRLTESEENEIVEWLINYKDLKYNEAIHLVFEKVAQKFELAQRPNPFNNGKPSMDWWYDFLSRHPQIMASKPDWLKRGKVNDQYIRDVQSGHLKCTKFRRALLSAIQYIKSLNDPASASILQSVTNGDPTSSHTTSSLNENKPKQNQKTNSNTQKTLKVKTPKLKTSSLPIKIEEKKSHSFTQSLTSTPLQHNNAYSNLLLNNNNHSLLNSSTNSFQNVIHNRNNSNCSSSTTVTTNSIDFNDEDLSSVSPISLINTNLTRNEHENLPNNNFNNENNNNNKPTDLFINVFDNTNNNNNKSSDLFDNNHFMNAQNLSDNDEDGESNIQEENLEDDGHVNVTYNTEIFNSELDDNDFERSINPDELIGKDDLHRRSLNHENFINQSIYNTEPKYSSNEIFLNNNYTQNIEADNFLNFRQQPLTFNPHIMNPTVPPNYHNQPQHYIHHNNIYNPNLDYHGHNNLLIGEDCVESDETNRLIHDHDQDGLICDTMYPSAYLH